MSKSQRTIGLTTKFLPFVALLIIFLFSATWTRTGALQITDFATAIVVMAFGGGGLVLIAEGFTQFKVGKRQGAIASASLIWFIGGIFIALAVMQFLNIYDIFIGIGDGQIVIQVIFIFGLIMLLAMTVWEVFLSSKLILHAPTTRT